MEALLKLIVGVDGVTAAMLVQVSYLYVATKVIHSLTVIATVLGVVALITKTVRFGITKASE